MGSAMRAAVLSVMLGMAALQGAAGPLDDPHLAVIPRTAAESARIAAITAPATEFTAAEPFESRPGGAATVRARGNADAFSQPSGNIAFGPELTFKLGNALFRKLWVSSPSSTQASDGLGPLYNARACQSCHVKDGRGHAPDGPDDDALSLVVALSVAVPGDAAMTDIETYLAALDGPTPRTRPHPVYGGQVQDQSVAGQGAEARVTVTWSEETVALSGGETATLRRPVWALDTPALGPFGPVLSSPRIAPQMIGLGLLEAIPAADILSRQDPLDADADGISGRASIVWSQEFARPMLGRFGWKAGAPTVREQSARAFAGDMGLSTPLFPAPWGDCTAAQPACRTAPHGDGGARGTEVDATGLDLVAYYARNLAVPARRGAGDPETLRGKALFHQTGCPACHTPKQVTHRLSDRPEQSFQLIWPFTDLLLHDMGEGLADRRPEGRATGAEWRTAPLWGIGMTRQVTGRNAFLHDGRARTVLEAILWHGGEARPARDRIVAMPPDDRAALLRYLDSL